MMIGDRVIGEFLGDQELLVYANNESEGRRILISLPLDSRKEWYPAGLTLEIFMSDYAYSLGRKFWES